VIAREERRLAADGVRVRARHRARTPRPLEVGDGGSFAADFSSQFDQAGIFVRESDERWIKAGVEQADGVLGGAVVTDGLSDWSVGAVPEWSGRQVRPRESARRCAPRARGHRG
jgi:hypothetical protein